MDRPVLRMCVGCRRVREQRELVRMTTDPAAGVVVNPPRRPTAPGRGAYLCPSVACLEKAWSRKVFSRAFRRELPGLREDVVRARFEAELERRGVLAGGQRGSGPRRWAGQLEPPRQRRGWRM